MGQEHEQIKQHLWVMWRKKVESSRMDRNTGIDTESGRLWEHNTSKMRMSSTTTATTTSSARCSEIEQCAHISD